MAVHNGNVQGGFGKKSCIQDIKYTLSVDVIYAFS
jgi:hypothetical protein